MPGVDDLAPSVEGAINQDPIMIDEKPTRRLLFLGAAALVALTTLGGGAALAQGRGWGPDGMGPPGQRRRRGWVPPGHRRSRRRGPPPGRGWRRWM
jgi:hypothetical protein